MPLFRKLPVEIEAMLFEQTERGFGTKASADAIEAWTDGRARIHEGDPVPEVPSLLMIETLEGRMSASPGDWIIKGVAGEFYPCKPEIFEQTYEPMPALDRAGSPQGAE